MAKNNKKNDKVLNKGVDMISLLSMATIHSGTVEYTNNKVGGLKKKLVESIMRMIGTSISPDAKTILNGLGVDASIKKTIDKGLVVTELYLRDKNVKGSKKVKVRTSCDNDYNGMAKELFPKLNAIDSEKSGKEISDYCNAVMGEWSEVRGSYDKMYKEDLKEMQKNHEKLMKEIQNHEKRMQKEHEKVKKELQKKDKKTTKK